MSRTIVVRNLAYDTVLEKPLPKASQCDGKGEDSAADDNTLDPHGNAASPGGKGIGDDGQGIAGNQSAAYGL